MLVPTAENALSEQDIVAELIALIGVIEFPDVIPDQLKPLYFSSFDSFFSKKEHVDRLHVSKHFYYGPIIMQSEESAKTYKAFVGLTAEILKHQKMLGLNSAWHEIQRKRYTRAASDFKWKPILDMLDGKTKKVFQDVAAFYGITGFTILWNCNCHRGPFSELLHYRTGIIAHLSRMLITKLFFSFYEREKGMYTYLT